MHQLGRITPVREHYTTSQLVQCSLNGVTPLSNKPRRGSRSNSYSRHCTRYGTLHPLRGATPDQNGCIAYVSGAARTLTSTTADTTAWHHPHHHQFRMQFPGDQTLQHPKNRRIPTFSFQKLKHLQGNCMRNFGDATERALSSPPATPPSRSRAVNKPPPSGCGGHSAHCDAQRPSR